MKTYPTRTLARAYRSQVNAKLAASGVKATLRDPVKGDDGMWQSPGINHGGKLSLKTK